MTELTELETVKELKIDIDHKEFDRVLNRFRFITDKFNELKISDVSVKETNSGYHIIVELSESLAKMYRALFQLFLGSDYKREALNFRRLLNYEDIEDKEDYNILFSKKYKGKELISEEIPAESEEEKLKDVVT